MKLIIPMAGRGTRVRPHSHVTPKPLLHVRGKNMVERIIETFRAVLPRPIDEAVFILGPDFGAAVENTLAANAKSFGITPHFAVQPEALGTAHAIHCAAEHLTGEGIVVFADTLFYMAGNLDFEAADAVVWVKHVDDPRRFGVAVREGERVVAFVEKPEEPISNEALIGIYYFKDLARIGAHINHMITHNERGNTGEFQLTDAMDKMLKEGALYKTAAVTDWLDCGTIPALVETTQVILEREQEDAHQGEVSNSVLIPPYYIGPGAIVNDAVVGPYASIEAGARVEQAVVQHSIVFAKARVQESVLRQSLVGQHAQVRGVASPVNIGDHSTIG